MFAAKTINQIRKISTSSFKSNPKFFGFLEHQPYDFSPVAQIDQQKVIRHKYPQRTLIDSSYRNPRHANDRQQWNAKQTKLRSSDMNKGSRRNLHVFVPQFQAAETPKDDFISSKDSFRMNNNKDNYSSRKNDQQPQQEQQNSERWNQEHGLQKDIDTSALYQGSKKAREQNEMKQSEMKESKSQNEKEQEFSQYKNKDTNAQAKEQERKYQANSNSQSQMNMSEQKPGFSESSKNRMFGNEEMAMKSDVKKDQPQQSQKQQSQKQQPNTLSPKQQEIVQGRAGTYPNGQSFDEGEPASWRGEEFNENKASSKPKGKQGDGREEFQIPNDPQYK